MAGRFAAVYSPAPIGQGGIGDNQQVADLAGQAASSVLTVGTNRMIAISVEPGATGVAVQGASVRFSLAATLNQTAASTDFVLPLNSITTFDTGQYYDSVSFFNMNIAANHVTISVMRLTW